MPTTQASLLLVDDNATNLQVLMQTLQVQGSWRLLAARSGEQALQIAQRAKPDLILLDIMMPGGMDGYQTCAKLKESAELAEIPVIFLSALSQASERAKGLKLGAVDFISKPFQAEEVLARVTTHLTIGQLQRKLTAQNEQLEHELAILRHSQTHQLEQIEGAFEGSSSAIQLLKSALEIHGPKDYPVLLNGHVDAGAEAIARLLHARSPRAGKAFIKLDCAILNASNSHTTLTDINRSTQELNLAKGGTLYLENAHLLPSIMQDYIVESYERNPEQTRLLLHMPGGTGTLMNQSDITPAFAKLIGQNVINIPALIERAEDFESLCHFYLEQLSKRVGKYVESIDPVSLAAMKTYSWPGQLRELESVLHRALIASDHNTLKVDQSWLTEGIPLGNYRLEVKIGEGGMGEVWRATHNYLARPAAVKLISRNRSEKDAVEAIARFEREAKSIAKLTSPHTVQIFDYGTSSDNKFYYVMELLEGLDTYKLVAHHGALRPERVIHLLKQACRSLIEAHASGLIHRDIKPENIFVSRLGAECDFVKLLDFGLVLRQNSSAESRLTEVGNVLGTPSFMSPEIILGEREITPHSDIYSLACVAFWMLTRRYVFSHDNHMATLMDHVRTDPPEPIAHAEFDISKDFNHLLLQCLSKTPAHRPDASELYDLLESLPEAPYWGSAKAQQWWETHLSNLTLPVYTKMTTQRTQSSMNSQRTDPLK